MSESGEQMKLALPKVFPVNHIPEPEPEVDVFSSILRGEEVRVPILDGPFSVRRPNGLTSALFVVANTSLRVVEREFQRLLEMGLPFNRRHSSLLKDAAWINVETPNKINPGVSCKGRGRSVFIHLAGDPRFPVHLELFKQITINPCIRGWMHINPALATAIA